jgi:hypothetical protein
LNSNSHTAPQASTVMSMRPRFVVSATTMSWPSAAKWL